jgi:pimeloyl-ACP methyl ester carboxylesterase
MIAPRQPVLVNVEGAQVASLDGGTIRYHSEGAGSHALLLLHGFNSQLSIWNGVWPELSECGRRVRIDIPGFGGSTWKTDSFSLESQAARVVSFLDAMQIERVTLVGVSMGGSLSAWIAANYAERVAGLVLLAPSAYPGSLRGRGLFAQLYGAGFWNRVATQIASSALFRRLHPESTALQALTVTSSYGESWARALHKIRAQTWLLWSRGDTTVPFAYAPAVASSIRESTLLQLPIDVGHDIPANRARLIGELACQVHLNSLAKEQTRASNER